MLEKPWKPQPETLFRHETQSAPGADAVSVIVTNYHYGKYVTDCLDSIAAQTHDALSLVVVDDNSCKDDSALRIAKWMEENKTRFLSTLLLRNVVNQGPAASRNTAMENCCSETVFIMDADNEILPTAISKLSACLKRSGARAAYSQLVEFGDRQEVGGADVWDIQRMRENNYVDIMALVEKSAWAEVGGFSHIEEGWEDYDFWLKFIDKGIDVVFLPEILCRYRVHGISRTATEAYKSHHDLEVIMRYRHPVLPAAPVTRV